MSSQSASAHSSPEPRSDQAYEQRNLLSLDGGGVRGLWSLLVLQELMEIVGTKEEAHEHPLENRYSSFSPLSDPRYTRSRAQDGGDRNRWVPKSHRYLPCHYFDLIAGSSTGGLIAIMLGRMRMTVPDCIDVYRSFSSSVFGDTKPVRYSRLLLQRYKYNTARFEKIVKDVITQNQQILPENVPNEIMFPCEDPKVCQVFVTTTMASKPRDRKDRGNDGANDLQLLRSYDCQKNPHKSRERINYGSANQWQVWQVARATSAAAYHFKPHCTDHHKFRDGAVGSGANPTDQGLQEFMETKRGPVLKSTIVSVGTSQTNQSGMFGEVRKIIQAAIDTEYVHQIVSSKADDNKNINYYRLNNLGSLRVDFDEWKPSRLKAKMAKAARILGKKSNIEAGEETVNAIDAAFKEWSKREEIIQLLNSCAEALVRTRRARASDFDRWERYADCARYDCCNDRFYHKAEFMAHRKQDHEAAGLENNNNLSNYRQRWEYPAHTHYGSEGSFPISPQSLSPR